MKRKGARRSRRFYVATLLALPLAGLAVLLKEPAAPVRRDAVTERDLVGERSPARVAPATVLRPPGPAGALATADPVEARELAAPLDDPARARDPSSSEHLLATAGDPRASLGARQVALAALRRAPDVDQAFVTRIHSIAVSAALDEDTRTRALDLLHQLAERRSCRPVLGALLLDAAAHAPSVEARALALEALPLDVSPDEVLAGAAVCLDDPSPLVRASVARALERAPARARGMLAARLEAALGRETDVDAGAVLLAAALRVARGDADALLARVEELPFVRAHDALTRQVTRYRAALAGGETDAQRIAAEHVAAEEERLLGSRR